MVPGAGFGSCYRCLIWLAGLGVVLAVVASYSCSVYPSGKTVVPVVVTTGRVVVTARRVVVSVESIQHFEVIKSASLRAGSAASGMEVIRGQRRKAVGNFRLVDGVVNIDAVAGVVVFQAYVRAASTSHIQHDGILLILEGFR